jgi:hypothetical protein
MSAGERQYTERQSTAILAGHVCLIVVAASLGDMKGGVVALGNARRIRSSFWLA